MFTMVKLAGQVPAGEIVFFRSFFALIPVLIPFAASTDTVKSVR